MWICIAHQCEHASAASCTSVLTSKTMDTG